VIAAGCAIIAAVSAIAWTRAASASVTWSSAGVLQFTDTKSGLVITCSASTGTMVPTNSGTNPGGHITSISFTGCAGPAGVGTITLTPKGLDWPVSALSTGRAIGETSGGHGVAVDVSAPACAAEVDGTGANTETGVAHFTFRRVSSALGVAVAGGNLHIYAVNGCLGLVSDGDPVSFTVRYHLS
jgi:hypothetical protein